MLSFYFYQIIQLLEISKKSKWISIQNVLSLLQKSKILR
jgi:hypothetical protein